MCDLSVVGADATDRIFHSYSQLSSITAATCTATATNARSGVGDAKEQQRVAPNYALPAEKSISFLACNTSCRYGVQHDQNQTKTKTQIMQSFWTGPRCPRGQSSSLHEKFHHRPSFPWGARLERTSTDRGWPRLKIARSTVDLRSCPSQAKRWCGRNPPGIPPSNHRGISSPVRQLGNWMLLLHRVHTYSRRPCSRLGLECFPVAWDACIEGCHLYFENSIGIVRALRQYLFTSYVMVYEFYSDCYCFSLQF